MGALKDIDNAIKLNPIFADYYLLRAELKLSVKRDDSACADYRTYKTLGGDREIAIRCE